MVSETQIGPLERARYAYRIITEFEEKLMAFWPDDDMKKSEPLLYRRLHSALNALDEFCQLVENYDE